MKGDEGTIIFSTFAVRKHVHVFFPYGKSIVRLSKTASDIRQTDPTWDVPPGWESLQGFSPCSPIGSPCFALTLERIYFQGARLMVTSANALLDCVWGKGCPIIRLLTKFCLSVKRPSSKVKKHARVQVFSHQRIM